jgi:hypothetical protein
MAERGFHASYKIEFDPLMAGWRFEEGFEGRKGRVWTVIEQTCLAEQETRSKDTKGSWDTNSSEI